MKEKFLLYTVFIAASVLFCTSCKKAENVAPDLTTLGVSCITPVSASCSAVATSYGKSVIIEKGVCWSKTQMPAVSENKTIENTSGKNFTSNITRLLPNTNYFVRAYLICDAGTVYGNELSFTTPVDHSGEQGYVIDIEGNVYNTLGIGAQIWMTDNLRTTKFSDNSSIPPGKCYRCWNYLLSPGYCWYDNDEENKPNYGGIYNWYTVNTTKLCPSGWHVPDENEWTILEAFPSQKNIPDVFASFPGGYRGDQAVYTGLGESGYFWASSLASTEQANYRSVDSKSGAISRGSFPIGWGASVRCIKD